MVNTVFSFTLETGHTARRFLDLETPLCPFCPVQFFCQKKRRDFGACKGPQGFLNISYPGYWPVFCLHISRFFCGCSSFQIISSITGTIKRFNGGFFLVLNMLFPLPLSALLFLSFLEILSFLLGLNFHFHCNLLPSFLGK